MAGHRDPPRPNAAARASAAEWVVTSTVLLAPMLPGRIAAGPLAGATRDDVRATLFQDLLDGRALWLDVADFALVSLAGQARLLRRLRVLRDEPPAHDELSDPPSGRTLGRSLGRARTDTARYPWSASRGSTDGRAAVLQRAARVSTVVLDWSTVRRVSVDVLAQFALIARLVRDDGAAVICCEPRDGTVARILEASGVARMPELQWASTAYSGDDSEVLAHAGRELVASLRTPAIVAPLRAQLRTSPTAAGPPAAGLAVADPAFTPGASVPSVVCARARDMGAGAAFTAAAESVTTAAERAGVATGVANALHGLIFELVANALSHAAARHTTLAVSYWPRSGATPAGFVLGVADDGIGIPAAVRRHLTQTGYGPPAVLGIPDRVLLADVFHGVHATGKTGMGRGMVQLLAPLLQAGNTVVTVRSGGVWLRLTRERTEIAVIGSASRAFGTVILADVRVPR